MIIAACRGLPRLVALFLEAGADPRAVGEGRFRLCGNSKSMHGCYTAAGWVDALLAAEEAAGVAAEDRHPLERCRKLLRAAREASGAGGGPSVDGAISQ